MSSSKWVVCEQCDLHRPRSYGARPETTVPRGVVHSNATHELYELTAYLRLNARGSREADAPLPDPSSAGLVLTIRTNGLAVWSLAPCRDGFGRQG